MAAVLLGVALVAPAQDDAYKLLKKVDLNGDGVPEAVLYHMRPKYTVDAKSYEHDRVYDLELIIQDGKTGGTQKFTVDNVTKAQQAMLMEPLKQPLKEDHPLLRAYPEFVIILPDRVETIGYNGKRFEHDIVRYERTKE